MGELPVTRAHLTDQLGRRDRDLRDSFTDHCSLRCTYCLPEEFGDWIPGDHLLSADEIVEVVSIAVSRGIQAVRLTGGEPLLNSPGGGYRGPYRRSARRARVAMTTNGLRLAQLANRLRRRGFRGSTSAWTPWITHVQAFRYRFSSAHRRSDKPTDMPRSSTGIPSPATGLIPPVV